AAPGGEVGIEAVAGDGREMMEDIFVEYVSPRFMLEWLYRVLASLRYPGYLRVRLESGGYLHVYTDDPERVAALLGAPQ
ncbi:MAG: hypothetical protein XD82_1503, partial [Methanoculleus marisnigri]